MNLEYTVYGAIIGYFLYRRRKAIKLPSTLDSIQVGLILTVFATAVTTLIWAAKIVRR